MAYEVTLPRLGWDMEEGALGGWLKQEGDYVNAGDLLFTVEGDKAVQEIEALDSGYLKFVPNAPSPGQKVPVGTLLGYLVSKEELASFDQDSPKVIQAVSAVETHATMPEPAPAQPQAVLPKLEERKRRIYISPYARRLAEGMGVNWQAVKGSGRGGRIMAQDVQAVADQQNAERAFAAAPTTMPFTSTPSPVLAPVATRQPMTTVRRSIFEHMAHSAHTTAPVTLNCEVDATELVALRRQLKEDPTFVESPVPSYNDMLAKIAAQALLEHPELNARIEGDEVIQFASAHIAVAVETGRGLLTPVLRDVQTKSLRQIARESAALIDQARQATVSYEVLQGGTFTITNLGMYEIETFTPIINLPQCAILGVGQIIPKQVVIDVEREILAIRQRMALSLTFDHRLVDGAQAARFLQRIKRLIEKPYLWLSG
jgi:pyruvate dehydrogenase E2 component (dihydrolipoamide acetyltransferase)